MAIVVLTKLQVGTPFCCYMRTKWHGETCRSSERKESSGGPSLSFWSVKSRLDDGGGDSPPGMPRPIISAQTLLDRFISDSCCRPISTPATSKNVTPTAHRSDDDDGRRAWASPRFPADPRYSRRHWVCQSGSYSHARIHAYKHKCCDEDLYLIFLIFIAAVQRAPVRRHSQSICTTSSRTASSSTKMYRTITNSTKIKSLSC